MAKVFCIDNDAEVFSPETKTELIDVWNAVNRENEKIFFGFSDTASEGTFVKLLFCNEKNNYFAIFIEFQEHFLNHFTLNGP